ISTLQRIDIDGKGGNDTLTLDNSNGVISIPDGIHFEGGLGTDLLNLLTTGEPYRAIPNGPIPGSGTQVAVSSAKDSAPVFVSNIEQYQDPTGAQANLMLSLRAGLEKLDLLAPTLSSSGGNPAGIAALMRALNTGNTEEEEPSGEGEGGEE